MAGQLFRDDGDGGGDGGALHLPISVDESDDVHHFPISVDANDDGVYDENGDGDDALLFGYLRLAEGVPLRLHHSSGHHWKYINKS